MARPAQLIEDRTPLDGAEVDVVARVGWLLRVSRVVPDVSLRELSARLRDAQVSASTSRLSAMETTGARSPGVIEGYERALGLEPARLRAAVDIVLRTFRPSVPDVALEPETPRQAPGPAELSRFDEVVARVLDADADGADWLAFAEAHAGASGFGLPSALMREPVERLVSQMGRSVGTAFAARYEALSLLRCGPYADVVADVVTTLVERPDTQVVLDAVSGLAERPSPDVLGWAVGLLASPSPMIARAAVLALENMRSVGGLGPAEWQRVAEPFVSAYGAGDAARRTLLTGLFKSLPAPVRRSIREGLDAPLAPVRSPAGWTASRRNVHYAVAEDIAAGACAAVGVAAQPMLARLLFEVLFDFRGPRTATSAFLVTASPFVDAVLPVLVDLAEPGSAADAETRDGALGCLVSLQPPRAVPDVGHWLGPDADEDRAACALALLGQAGVHPPGEVLERLVGRLGLRGRVLYCAGMAEHPVLARWAEDPSDPWRRDAARWWRREGGRVVR